MKSIKKYLLIIGGSISLIFGIIGIFLPVLPTTPFLLLAAYCYIRSSKKLYQWLINNKILGDYIYIYMNYKAVLKSTKIYATVFLWLSLIVSMMIIETWWIHIILLSVGIGVSVHLSSLKTMAKSEFIKNKLENKKDIK